MRRTTVFLGFVAVVLFGLSGCGSSKSPNRGVDGSPQVGGQNSASTATGQGGSQGTSTGAAGAGGIATSGTGGGGAGGTQASTAPTDAGIVPDAPVLGGNSGTGGNAGTSGSLGGGIAGAGGNASTGGRPADGGVPPDAPDAAASCPGPNPAAVGCRSSATACVPSACSCAVRSGAQGWECTADCRTNLPLCPDAGAGPDTGVDSGRPGIPCGNTFCSSGEYCCNANCSTCVREGVDCALVLCEPPAEWTCASDSDCKAVDDYCGGCNCRAMGSKGQLGTCTKELVSCITAPCTTKKARCEDHQCVLVTK